jgi:hypothetical protein
VNLQNDFVDGPGLAIDNTQHSGAKTALAAAAGVG